MHLALNRYTLITALEVIPGYRSLTVSQSREARSNHQSPLPPSTWHITCLLSPEPPGTMPDLLASVRYSLRLLLKSPGFTVTAVLILGSGIGANTTIFSLIDTVLLRPLAYPETDRLVTEPV